MCGIAGEIRFDGTPADVAAVTTMTATLHRRGPDGWGIHAGGHTALGHRRLKIIDLSDRAVQPMVDPQLGLTGVFNGCIYNYRELRSELRSAGYQFFSDSDSEVLLKAYHHWGVGCVNHFLGMFAFAVLERDSGRLVLGRDRLGIKPLYLSHTPGRLRFASTLPALLAAGEVDTAIDPVGLHHYLSFHSVVPPPRTILAGVQKLPPATVRTVAPDGRVEDRQYWQPAFSRGDPDMTAAQWPGAVLDALRLAVQRRMVADVPVGILLSGGIDSSLVVALLAEGAQHGLRTFSVGFEAAAGEVGDEFVYSDQVAAHFGTEHQKIMISSDRLLPAVDAAIDAMSEPMVSHDCVAFYLLSQEVSRSVTVVQSGQGADEVFAGYDWYPPLAGVPREAAAAAYAKVFVDRPHAELAELLEPEWLAGSLREDHSQAFIGTHFGAPGADTALDAALRLDTTVMLVDDPVKRVDNMTMAWGVEARVPFLDHQLVELAGACPPALKLASGGKGVLKAASRGLVPDPIIDRPKGKFPVPAIRHLSGAFLDRVREAVTDPVAKDRGLFRPDWLHRMLADPNTERTTLGSNALWQVALLEMWLQERGI